jgi:hypothetical protein
LADFWAEELTEEQTEALLQKAADEIRRRKLETPAILFLEMHRPVSSLLIQSSIPFAPFLIPILGFEAVNDFSRLLAKRENVERLIRLIERPVDREAATSAEALPG